MKTQEELLTKYQLIHHKDYILPIEIVTDQPKRLSLIGKEIYHFVREEFSEEEYTDNLQITDIVPIFTILAIYLEFNNNKRLEMAKRQRKYFVELYKNWLKKIDLIKNERELFSIFSKNSSIEVIYEDIEATLAYWNKKRASRLGMIPQLLAQIEQDLIFLGENNPLMKILSFLDNQEFDNYGQITKEDGRITNSPKEQIITIREMIKRGRQASEMMPNNPT